uniref:Hemin uptake protein HemP n=1 Tax=Rhodopseudomonas palustris (strain BisA53) TaxID=316055 RepID=Q07LU6_RHOP5
MIVRTGNDDLGTMHLGSSTPATGRTINVSGNRLDSRQLFVSDREIIIAHGDDTYRLRLTSQNKLILTK